MKDINLWQFILQRLKSKELVTLLQVVESIGSSPGRQGFRMAITEGVLMGSIGGGVMEQKLVTLARSRMREGRVEPLIKKQIHNKEVVQDQSGMICSGEQTVLFYTFKEEDIIIIEKIIACLNQNYTQNNIAVTASGAWREGVLFLSDKIGFQFLNKKNDNNYLCIKTNESIVYEENLGFKNHLYIIGGGHCSLALSKQMRLLDSFKIHLLDDRDDLNTFIENDFAHVKLTVDYAHISDFVPEGNTHYVVIMTVGYRSDDVVLRGLLSKNFKYIGLLGSQAKVDTMFQNLRNEGVGEDVLKKIHAPIGLSLKSQTPEEIAVSIAAEIIGVRWDADFFVIQKESLLCICKGKRDSY